MWDGINRRLRLVLAVIPSLGSEDALELCILCRLMHVTRALNPGLGTPGNHLLPRGLFLLHLVCRNRARRGLLIPAEMVALKRPADLTAHYPEKRDFKYGDDRHSAPVFRSLSLRALWCPVGDLVPASSVELSEPSAQSRSIGAVFAPLDHGVVALFDLLSCEGLLEEEL